MGGTSNPSEEQLALVTARVIEIASAISETAASLDGSGYFEKKICSYVQAPLQDWRQSHPSI